MRRLQATTNLRCRCGAELSPQNEYKREKKNRKTNKRHYWRLLDQREGKRPKGSNQHMLIEFRHIKRTVNEKGREVRPYKGYCPIFFSMFCFWFVPFHKAARRFRRNLTGWFMDRERFHPHMLAASTGANSGSLFAAATSWYISFPSLVLREMPARASGRAGGKDRSCEVFCTYMNRT